MKSVNDPGWKAKEWAVSNFGQNNLTFSGDDKANPSQYAGYDNAYFRRNEPSEEHPEDSNFIPLDQEQLPGIPAPGSPAKQGEQHRQAPNPQQEYREGTADDDGQKGDNPQGKADNSAYDAGL